MKKFIFLMMAATLSLFAACSNNSNDEGNKIAVASVTLDESTISLLVDGTATLTATAAPENATDKTVTWKSDAAGIAQVDATGKVTGISTGTTKITATAHDGSGKFATCLVEVVDEMIAVTGVTIDPTKLELTVGGESATLTAIIAPENATNKNVAWAVTEGAGFITLTGEGKTVTVAPVAAGTATITVTTEDGEHTKTCEVTVKTVPVTDVTLDKTSATLDAGKTLTLTATVAPADATNKNVTWAITEGANFVEPLAIDGNKVTITGKAAGTVTVTVTSAENSEIKKTCTITVQEAEPVPVTDVTLDKTSATIAVGKTTTLTAAVIPQDADEQGVSWAIAEGGSDFVTLVANSNTATITGKAAGTATITVTSTDGNITKSCTITVTPAATESVNLLGNPGFEDPNDASTALPSPWIAINGADEWFASYYSAGNPSGDARPGQGNASMVPNRLPTNDTFMTSGNGADLLSLVVGTYVARIPQQQRGGIYQIIENVVPGSTYEFGAVIGYRNNNGTQYIRTKETLKILSEDGLTTVYAEPIAIDEQQSPSNANAKISITHVSGTVTIPVGVTTVRFQFDSRNGLDADTGTITGTNAPLMLVDECFFRLKQN